jgi:hypothetical protein
MYVMIKLFDVVTFIEWYLSCLIWLERLIFLNAMSDIGHVYYV